MMKQAVSFMMAITLTASSLLGLPADISAAGTTGTPIKPQQDVTVYSNGYYLNSKIIAADTVNYHQHADDGGAADIMRVGLQDDGTSAYTYMKYDISGIPVLTPGMEVELAFQASSSEQMELSVYGLHPLQAASDWSETTMTWRSKFLNLTDSIDTIQIPNASSGIQFNLTDYIMDNQKAGKSIIGLVMKAETTGVIELRGHETTDSAGAGRIPVLIVNEQSDLSGHWARKQVEQLASKFLVHGAGDDRFIPDAAITRAEFAALVTRAIGLAAKVNGSFADVSGTAWYAGAVGAASAAGIVEGDEAHAFKPDASITREEMAVMIVRALRAAGLAEQAAEGGAVAVDAALARFEDSGSISGYAKAAISEALQAGIVEGMTASTFAPQNNATRAEAAVMLQRMLTYMHFN
ncbi:S-layer homology domain-containing protein [Paenibacillus sp. GCM10023248]|uniref:S-layer homology domain-containing protein n=1 Tax=unclassified Paenibacillus TaxID=185978 RepID=UPI002379B36B|nr:S-layer homology domain-containing protein [Paenibacillus sp. MAHUQ-63]MDD9268147.1 S-layer homology domain-containing protein [Paenibacillus sp. MAHUQ-63]